MTQASVDRDVSGKEWARAGKTTLTMERSSEAMNPPNAVTAKIGQGTPPRCSSGGRYTPWGAGRASSMFKWDIEPTQARIRR